MALSDVIKKKQETGNENAQKAEKKSLLDDVRVVIAVLVVLILALIGLIVYETMNINNTKASIEEMKLKYTDNQNAIGQLVALQKQSELYKARKAEYDNMLSSEPLDQTEIMISLENQVESYKCTLNEITFDEVMNTGLVNQINVYVSVTGKYNDILRFCHDVVNEEQIKRIDKINMTQISKDSDEMKAELTIVEFSK